MNETTQGQASSQPELRGSYRIGHMANGDVAVYGPTVNGTRKRCECTSRPVAVKMMNALRSVDAAKSCAVSL